MIKQEWEQLYRDISLCQACDLAHTRTHTVPGEGDHSAAIMMVGEGPGADEDRTGRPFVGRAGQLLDKMLDAFDVSRQQVYICNIIKCRPPGNRNPASGEMRACLPHLTRQIALVNPSIIVCLGKIAAGCLMHENFAITRERGVWQEKDGRSYLATFHPAALLRDERLLIDAWRDMRAVAQRYAQQQGGAHE
ncbi:MAG: uracil-DNA glycosylase [Eubacteriales bacterium]|nr:uracil-DNA glycosylase [Eubacteriales bacterium]